ncbi:glycoside hydrolase family 3 domain protein [Terriglobus saanensis SP1PR4]|uniref:Glycoside hydrolase family 3 domain protein n=2 Tax=Terriglobus saanensis TaxID=870903 RepID=E8V1I3_TERSS|nr:glycoside hydrolase family 3 domain protein [Terriglobus saanensis SP1PR4]
MMMPPRDETSRSRTRFSILLAFLLLAAPAFSQVDAMPDTSANSRIDSLIQQMTLEEKVDMLSGETLFSSHGVPRLHIPSFWMSDGPVGAHIPPPSTAYAAGIGLAATWDPDLAQEVGVQLGRDARSRGAHFLLGPGVNIYRAPMNGRNFEYFGEDPYLGGKIAVGYIRGVQSQDVVATIKHFMGNNSEYARFTTNSIIDERTMREIYLPIFETAVKEGHVGSVMDSYNLTNGTYMTANRYLNIDVLKQQWGFDGVLMSDWTAAHDGIADANAGLDLEMPFGTYMNRATLLPAIKAGTISQATIDDKIRRMLRLATRFHWLEREQRDATIPRYNQQGREAALKGAQEGMVLLKNEGALLPLDKTKVQKIAVFGTNAFPGSPTAGGSGEVPTFKTTSILTGISDNNLQKQVTYARGIPTLHQVSTRTHFFQDAAEKKPGLLVESFASDDCTGPSTGSHVESAAEIGHPGFGTPEDIEDMGLMTQADFIVKLGSTSTKKESHRWTGYYKPKSAGEYLLFVEATGKFRLSVDGKVEIDSMVLPKAVMNQIRIHLTGDAHKVVIDQGEGEAFQEPFLRVAIAKEKELVDPMALELAKNADVAVVAVGFDADTETEGADRGFALPPGQEELIRQIAAANPKTVVVLSAGGSVATAGWLEKVPAVFQVWYSGQEGGTAFNQALFGEINPSGRLPFSWERRIQDNPSVESYYPAPKTLDVHYTDGIFVGYRGYEHKHTKPLFPFGYGLSYTSFRYEHLKIEPATEAGTLYQVSFDVTNIGSRSGADVAQLYVGEKSAPVPRPVKELKGFKRVLLNAGETQHIVLPLNARALTYYDVAAKAWKANAGSYTVEVGRSSEELELKGDLSLTTPITVSVDAAQ